MYTGGTPCIVWGKEWRFKKEIKIQQNIKNTILTVFKMAYFQSTLALHCFEYLHPLTPNINIQYTYSKENIEKRQMKGGGEGGVKHRRGGKVWKRGGSGLTAEGKGKIDKVWKNRNNMCSILFVYASMQPSSVYTPPSPHTVHCMGEGMKI